MSAKRVVEIVGVCMLVAGCSRPAENPPQETAAPAAASAPAPVTAGWTLTEAIEAPESVYVDADSGFIFASQIVGAPDAKDGNGRIAKLSGDGKMIAAEWVAHLHAPKGLRACQGTLWAADLGEVIGVEIASGRIASRVALPNAQFPNDVACGGDGTVYVSDMIGNRIYAVKDGAATVFAEGEQLEWPNGLLVDGDRLIVGGWGRPEADFTTKVPGRLFSLDLKTKAKTLITPKPFANIDGVELDGRGGYVISDWVAGRILQVTAAGEVHELRLFKQGTADIAFIPAGNILIVPHMSEAKIAAYDVSNAIK
jgi:hypothetical protein